MSPSYDPDTVRPGNVPKKQHPMLGNVEKKLTIIHIGNPFGSDLEHDAGVPEKPSKVSQEDAGYGCAPEHCGNCIMFRPGKGGMGTCTKVAGVIDPKLWCKLWEAATSEEEDEEGE